MAKEKSKKEKQKKENTSKYDKLFWKKESAWLSLKESDLKETMHLSDELKTFLNESKTEYEIASSVISVLKKNDFKPLSEIKNLSLGTKFFVEKFGKIVCAGIIGKQSISAGFNAIAVHSDSPRLDLKPNPLIEEAGSSLALLKTHYYGSIKKYQWMATPLAMHAIIMKTNGEKLKIVIGEKENEPVFSIADLLPHVLKNKEDKPNQPKIEAEDLHILIGSIPVNDKKVKDKIKANILFYLNEKFGLTEKDFVSSAIEFVPAFKATDLGFDKSLISSYGLDDKVHCFLGLKTLVSLKNPDKTCLLFVFDKEEIGSEGITGAQSNFIESCLLKLFDFHLNENSFKKIMNCLENSNILSADVTSGLTPSFEGAFDSGNTALLGFGASLEKTTGSGGKYDGSEANPEFFSKIIRILEKEKVIWQSGEISKIDLGGGGTIAKYFAKRGCNVIDIGVPLLGMHSPLEIASKVDCYFALKAFQALLEKM